MRLVFLTVEDGLVVPHGKAHDVSHDFVSSGRPSVEEMHAAVGALRGHQTWGVTHHLPNSHLDVRPEQRVQPPRFGWGRGRRHAEARGECAHFLGNLQNSFIAGNNNSGTCRFTLDSRDGMSGEGKAKGDGSGWGWGTSSDWGMGDLDITATMNSLAEQASLAAASAAEQANAFDVSAAASYAAQQASLAAEQAATQASQMAWDIESSVNAMDTESTAETASLGLDWMSGPPTVSTTSTSPVQKTEAPDRWNEDTTAATEELEVSFPPSEEPEPKAEQAVVEQTLETESPASPPPLSVTRNGDVDATAEQGPDRVTKNTVICPSSVAEEDDTPGPTNVPTTEEDARATELRTLRATLAAREAQLLSAASSAAAAREAETSELRREIASLRAEAARDDGGGDLVAELEAKTREIREWTEEGEALSKRQAELEGAIKAKNGKIRELERARADVETRLEDEIAKRGAAEAQRTAFVSEVTEARRATTAAEAKADGEARGKLEAALRDARETERALREETIGLREAAGRALETAGRREERTAEEIKELELRWRESQARHEELASRLPESTRPLLRQIESMRLGEASAAEARAVSEKASRSRTALAEQATQQMEAIAQRAQEEAEQARADARNARVETDEARTERASISKTLAAERASVVAIESRAAKAVESAAQRESASRAVDAKTKTRDARLRQELAAARAHAEAAASRRDAEREESVAREKTLEGLVRALRAEIAVSSVQERDRITATTSGPMHANKTSLALHDATRFATPGNEGGVELAVARATDSLRRLVTAREGELGTAEARILDLENTQKQLANELLAVQSAIDTVGDPRRLSRALHELEERHVAALELMGETSEENETLAEQLEALKATIKVMGGN